MLFRSVLNAIIPEISKRYTTVSGLAIGVDSCVHQLSANNTIAVLGCGIDYIYPLSNHHLFTVMANKHLILSEYPDKVKPMKTNFPFRNRIIVGLSKKLIVAQARIKSGTMHSVNYALEIDNDIYVIPHMFDDEKGLGSNLLIKEGANILLTSDIKML